jgi:hypothetical protein
METLLNNHGFTVKTLGNGFTVLRGDQKFAASKDRADAFGMALREMLRSVTPVLREAATTHDPQFVINRQVELAAARRHAAIDALADAKLVGEFEGSDGWEGVTPGTTLSCNVYLRARFEAQSEAHRFAVVFKSKDSAEIERIECDALGEEEQSRDQPRVRA